MYNAQLFTGWGSHCVAVWTINLKAIDWFRKLRNSFSGEKNWVKLEWSSHSNCKEMFLTISSTPYPYHILFIILLSIYTYTLISFTLNKMISHDNIRSGSLRLPLLQSVGDLNETISIYLDLITINISSCIPSQWWTESS